MTDVAQQFAEDCEEPDVSHLITEDDEPVDNPFSEKQQRMLVESLHASWTEDLREGRPFVAFANVGLFFVPKNPALVPDVQVSLDVSLPSDIWAKKNRAYMTWVYGKPPEIVLEIVSNTKGGETDRKFKTYAEQGVAYYVIYDPKKVYGNKSLRVYELHGRTYVSMLDPSWLPGALIGLKTWQGSYEEYEAIWMRWCDRHGDLLPLSQERIVQERESARVERQKAEAERERAEAERQNAEAEHQRAEAERERAEAERQKAEAQHQRAEAEHQRAEAERERAEAERQKAEAQHQRAEAEHQRAEAERQKAEAERERVLELEARLRELGEDV